MSSYANFLSWFYTNNQQNVKPQQNIKPHIKPGPARNVPENIPIQSVKSFVVVRKKDLDQKRLRHVIVKPRKTYYAPRHPVLQEILSRAYQKSMRRQVCLAVHEYFQEEK